MAAPSVLFRESRTQIANCTHTPIRTVHAWLTHPSPSTFVAFVPRRYRNNFSFGGRYKNGSPLFECGPHWLWKDDDGTWVSNGGDGDYSKEFWYPDDVSSRIPPVGEWVSCAGDNVGWKLER